MKSIYKEGDRKLIKIVITNTDVAAFNANTVHNVCSTYALARNIEWATRQYVLEMIDIDEEGIGTYLKIHHKSPAMIGEILTIESEVKSMVKNQLICRFKVSVDDRMIAFGETGQRILKKEKLEKIFSSLEK